MKSLSLNMKISFVITIFIVGAVVISVIGIQKLGSLNDSIDNVVEVVVKRMLYARDIQDVQREMTIAEKNYILEPSKEGMTTYGDQLKSLKLEIEKIAADFDRLASPEGKAKMDAYKNRFAAWYQLSEELQKLSWNGQNDAAFALSRGKSRDARLEMEKVMEEIVELNLSAMKAENEATTVMYQNARTMVITISLAAILSGIVLAFVIMRAVGNTINQVISNLDDNSSQVTSASAQIATAAEQLSQASTEQAASLQQTASAIEELSSMIQRNSDNAKKSEQLSNTSQSSADRGKDVVQKMLDAIDGISSSNSEIKQQIDDSNRQISEIVTVIAEIGNKTKVINDIVFQTKLLSFNASVEAARAGEHGKGFAVVAEEVGNLAQMSGNAAKEISEMLEGSMQKVDSIVNDTKTKVERLVTQGREKVEVGIEIANECRGVLDEIVSNVTDLSQMASEIAGASQEQAQGVQEIAKAMNQLDQVTQENAATSEEAASSSEELSAQAESLRGVVRLLVQAIRGGNRGAESTETFRTASSLAQNHVQNSKHAKVVAFKKTGAVAAPKDNVKSTLAKAAGMDGDVPSGDDPRFKDI